MGPRTALTGKDILLLLLYAPNTDGEPCGIMGRTRLTKMVFLFEKEVYEDFKFDREIARDKLPAFYPWNYGPFSRDVYADIDFFVHIQFVRTRQCSDEQPLREEAEEYQLWETDLDDPSSTTSVTEYAQELIDLTVLGRQYVEDREVWSRLSSNQQAALIEFKRRFSEAPLFAILRYVYDRYPDMTSKSVIREQVVGQGRCHP